MVSKAFHAYVEMWREALFPKDDLDKMMRFPMALHLVAIGLFLFSLRGLVL